MSLLPPKDANSSPRVTDVRILLVYRMGASRGVYGQTVGADGSGDFAVGFTGDSYEEADAKCARFMEAMVSYSKRVHQKFEILTIIADSWSRDRPIFVDPPASLEKASSE